MSIDECVLTKISQTRQTWAAVEPSTEATPAENSLTNGALRNRAR